MDEKYFNKNFSLSFLGSTSINDLNRKKNWTRYNHTIKDNHKSYSIKDLKKYKNKNSIPEKRYSISLVAEKRKLALHVRF